MSSGLMSCVRHNSPPLELSDATEVASGPLSLPVVGDTSIEIVGERSPSTTALNLESGDGGATPQAEQHKKRRFHPLRNLRRMFRRRTITSVSSDAPAASRHMNTLPVPKGAGSSAQANSTSEKNLRSVTLSPSMAAAPASSPSSPLTHQQLQDAYASQSLPKSKTFAHERGKYQQTLQRDTHGESSTDYEITRVGPPSQSQSHHPQAAPRMSMGIGVAVLPPIGAAHGRNFFAERKALRSVGNSTRELDSSENDSGPSSVRRGDTAHTATHDGSPKSSDISDSQRSLSEGRLVDSSYSHEGLSQSHDSVFSESATASNLSIVIRAELANVLRKRTRPDGSDEDLGLPRSPGSPQRRAEQTGIGAGRPARNTTATNTNQSEVSSVSLLSMNSAECVEFQATSTANNSMEHQQSERVAQYTRSATFSSMPSEMLRHPVMSASFNEDNRDEVDLFSSDWQRLSHAAAKHKMAIRPMKRNVPSRQQRRPQQNSIPEANEEFKASNSNRLEITNAETKEKSRSLPPGVNAKILDQHAAQDASKGDKIAASSAPTNASMITLSKNSADSTVMAAATSTKATPLSETYPSLTKVTMTSNSPVTRLFGLRSAFSGKSEPPEGKTAAARIITTATTSTAAAAAAATDSAPEPAEPSESGFLRRLIQRNSKRNYAKANTSDELDKNVVSEPKKIPISTSCFDMTPNMPAKNQDDDVLVLKSKSAMSYEQSINETRKEIKREILSEGKTGLSAILNNYIPPESAVSGVRISGSNRQAEATPAKPKSGPAARQRYVPQNITISNSLIEEEKRAASSNAAVPEQEVYQSKTILHGLKAATAAATAPAAAAAATTQPPPKSSPTKTPYRGKDSSAPQHHFEKKPKIVGLSAFQQKISRSNDSVVRISASNASLDAAAYTDEEQQQAKQRTTTVEKSRSFRTYTEEQRESTSYARSNMPSLPDLSLNFRVSGYLHEHRPTPPSPTSKPAAAAEKCVSLGYEMNGSDAKQKKKPSPSSPPTSVETSDVAVQTAKDNNRSIVWPQVTTTITTTITTESETDSFSYRHNVNVIPTAGGAPPPKRPTSLALSGKTKSEEQLKMPPARSISNPGDEAAAAAVGIARIKHALSASTKEIDRKSAPAPSTSSNGQGVMRHSASLGENLQDTQQQPPPQGRGEVPEFMKIQLNHIDQERFTGKAGNVVFAKNIKESVVPPAVAKPKVSPRTLLNDANGSEAPQPIPAEQKKKPSEGSTETSPKSPVKKSTSSPIDSPSDIEVILRERPDVAAPPPPPSSNKTSLQDRMRLFMADADEEKKKIETIRSENKKSLSEEVTRRLSTIGRKEEKSASVDREMKATPNASPPPSPTSPTTNGTGKAPTPTTPSPTENNVILRKKSFGLSASNGNNNNNSNGNNSVNVHKDDSTPELMKVFARRSLKVKDEDIGALTDKHLSDIKKPATVVAQRLSSYKENQPTTMEEKSNKTSVNVEETIAHVAHDNLPATTNQSAALDSRNGFASKAINNNNNSNNKSNNGSKNNNNNNNTTTTTTTTNDSSSKCSQLPPIKYNNGFRASISNGVTVTSSITERSAVVGVKTPKINAKIPETTNNNNNNNNHENGNSIKRTYGRQSLNIRTLDPASAATEPPPTALIANSKTIERSATISEFKNIDQRRREWELRAKEAFK